MKPYNNPGHFLKLIPAFAVLSSLTCTSVSASGWIQQLSGTWQGTGSGKPNAKASPQRIKCQLSGQSNSSSQMTLSGRCATVKRRGSVSLKLREKSPNSYSASARNVFAKATVQYTGKSNGRRLTLVASKPFAINGKSFRSRIVLKRQGPNRFSLTETLFNVKTGKRFISLQTSFAGKK